MKNRIKEIRNNEKLNQEQFANIIGLTKNFISLVETGARIPSDRTINDICREFHVNEDWLRTGNGNMYKQRTREQEIGIFVSEVMSDVEESFRRKFILALSRLNEKEWEVLEKLANELKEG